MKKMMYVRTISSKGQIIIPQAIRRNLRIYPGTQLEIRVEADTFSVRKHAKAHRH
ncbi:MAG: AbrB/MazE/SpoVT family DNA-binding domain-containing protein [Acidobacteria bacterium]|nr:AbrB/MazE/SpoVT family DNA-binding domain-containing protein [Acidobacteriota bacterium]